MKRIEKIRARTDLAGHGARRGIAKLAVLALLASLLVACQSAAAPTEEPLPAYLRLSPCGGQSLVRSSGSTEWLPAEGQIVLEAGALVAAEGVDGGRLCAADGSVLELAPGATVAVGPTGDASRLEIALQEGSLLVLALEPAYQFVAPSCLVSVSEVPARFSVALNSAATRLRVEEGQATCTMESETITVDACSEIIAAPGAEPEIGAFCVTAPQATATLVTRSPTPVTPTRTPTDTPTPTRTPTITPTPTPTPTAIRRVFIPTSTPIPPPTNTPYLQPTQGNGGGGGNGGNGGNGDGPKPTRKPTAVKE